MRIDSAKVWNASGRSSPAGEELRSCFESWSHGNGTPPLAPPYMGFSITWALLAPALLPESATAEDPSAAAATNNVLARLGTQLQAGLQI